MHAQLTYFDGPRSPELVTAADRASRERIIPAILARPELREDLVGLYQLRRPDGGEITVVIVEREETLDKAREVIMSTELLPGEDPALLPGPDRSERYQVAYTLVGQAADAELAVR
ncbi:MAG: hypothetical protein ABWZ98_14160 [Nakamurella sp.]